MLLFVFSIFSSIFSRQLFYFGKWVAICSFSRNLKHKGEHVWARDQSAPCIVSIRFSISVSILFGHVLSAAEHAQPAIPAMIGFGGSTVDAVCS